MATEADPLERLRTALREPNLGFPAKPSLIPDLCIYPMPDGLGIQFRGGEAPVVIRGRDAQAACDFLLPKLDGRHSIEDLESHCPDTLNKTTLLKTLFLLHNKGLLTGQPVPSASPVDPVTARQLLFWGRKATVTRSASGAAEIEARLKSSVLVLIGTGLFGGVVYDLLTRAGIEKITLVEWSDDGFLSQTTKAGPAPPIESFSCVKPDDLASRLENLSVVPDLLVTATRNAPAVLFHAINLRCLQQEWRWLRGNEDDSGFDVGPLVLPYASACSTCVELRQASASDFAVEQHLYEDHLANTEQPSLVGEDLLSATLAASCLAQEVVRILTGIAPPTVLNAVLRLNPLTGSWQMNRALRVPRCPDCYRGTAPYPKV